MRGTCIASGIIRGFRKVQGARRKRHDERHECVAQPGTGTRHACILLLNRTDQAGQVMLELETPSPVTHNNNNSNSEQPAMCVHFLPCQRASSCPPLFGSNNPHACARTHQAPEDDAQARVLGPVHQGGGVGHAAQQHRPRAMRWPPCSMGMTLSMKQHETVWHLTAPAGVACTSRGLSLGTPTLGAGVHIRCQAAAGCASSSRMRIAPPR